MPQCGYCGRLTKHTMPNGHRVCKKCQRMLANPSIVIGANGKGCRETTGVCSCCGQKAGWKVYRAGWFIDGIYMARLCGDDQTQQGCIFREIK